MSWRSDHRERVEQLEAEAAKVMMDALAAVVDRVADRLGVLTAAAEGEARASVDDLSAIAAEWKATVDQVVLPYFGGIFEAGAHAGEEQLAGLGVVVPAGDPELIDTAARQYLGQVQDRFYGLGDTAWENARHELLQGFQAGEGIGDLRARVRRATGLSRYRAEAIARTEVIGASNMGADARVAQLGADAPPYKQWLSTLDGRTRPTHVRADGQVVPRAEPFRVGGYTLQVPGAPTGPPEEVISCRCTVLYLDSPEPIDPEGRQQGGITDLVADPDLTDDFDYDDRDYEPDYDEVYATASTAAITPAEASRAFAIPDPPATPPAPTFSAYPVPYEVDQYIAHQWRHWRNDLSDADRKALSFYTGGNFEDLNTGLRSGTLTRPLRTRAEALDSALAGAALPHDLWLYRGIDSRFARTLAAMHQDGNLLGSTFEDKSFVSTTVRESTAQTFGQSGAVLAIRAPKGTPGAGLGSLSDVAWEGEVVLPRDLTFRVVGVEDTPDAISPVRIILEIVT